MTQLLERFQVEATVITDAARRQFVSGVPLFAEPCSLRLAAI
jgi:hypothetical protein